MVICLGRGADLHMAQLMPLPHTVSCFSKIQIGFTFLVPPHLSSPGQRAIKRACVCVFTILCCKAVQITHTSCFHWVLVCPWATGFLYLSPGWTSESASPWCDCRVVSLLNLAWWHAHCSADCEVPQSHVARHPTETAANVHYNTLHIE